MKATTPVEQITGDLKAAIRSIGRHGRVTVVVEAIGEDGDLVHRVEWSRMTDDEVQRLIQEPPRARRR